MGQRRGLETGMSPSAWILLQVADPRQPILMRAQDLNSFFTQLTDVLKGGKQTIKTLHDISAQLDSNFTNMILFLLQAIAVLLLLP